MGRPCRINYPGLIYHVVSRGNNRQSIFRENKDYEDYLRIVLASKKKYKFKLLAYCLMTNHVHLLIQVTDKASISKIMQAITVGHTLRYHYKNHTCGHVWQGRFKSPVVSDDEYLLTVMRYIEQNPLRAGMVKRLEEYQWSSYLINSNAQEDVLIDKEENPAYHSLGQTAAERAENYFKIICEKLTNQSLKDIRGSILRSAPYVSPIFMRRLAKLLPIRKKRGRPRKATRQPEN